MVTNFICFIFLVSGDLIHGLNSDNLCEVTCQECGSLMGCYTPRNNYALF